MWGINIKFVKKGNLAKSEAEELLIVDESQKAYKADPAVIAVWDMCDGQKTQEQIVDDLAKDSKTEKTQVSKVVSDILVKLEQVDLVQKV